MKVTVPSYGLHFISGGIGLLVQEDGVQDITGIDMGIEVSLAEKLPQCPHQIDLEERDSQPIADHPLMLLSLPVPKKVIGPSYVSDTPDNRDVVQNLLRLSGAHNRSSFFPLWSKTRKEMEKLLKVTNLTPLVLYGYQSNSSQALDTLIEMSSMHERPIIVMGDRWVLPGAPHPEKLDLDISQLPLEKIGAHHLYKRMMDQ